MKFSRILYERTQSVNPNQGTYRKCLSPNIFKFVSVPKISLMVSSRHFSTFINIYLLLVADSRHVQSRCPLTFGTKLGFLEDLEFLINHSDSSYPQWSRLDRKVSTKTGFPNIWLVKLQVSNFKFCSKRRVLREDNKDRSSGWCTKIVFVLLLSRGPSGICTLRRKFKLNCFL